MNLEPPSVPIHHGPSADDLRKVINRHGHAFQNAVLRHSGELFAAARSRWVFEAAEVPVEIRGAPTRIDFVLRQLSWNRRETAKYLVAECKRANPALSHWCFARMPFIRRDACPSALIVDRVFASGQVVAAEADTVGHSADVYGIAYELRSHSKGDGAPGRGAIEEACGQVIRGVNGFVEILQASPTLLTVNQPTPVVPVVFTTANLWVTETDLALADLASGELPQDTADLKQVPWLWLRYHSTPGLLHTGDRSAGEHADLGRLVEALYARCIAIVSPQGVADFLSQEEW